MSNCCSSSLGRRRAIALVIVATLTSAYAAAADFSGKWSGSSPGNDSVGTTYAVLKQEGTMLTGSAGPGESKQFQITTGKVDGAHLIFEVKMGGGTIRFDLTSTSARNSGGRCGFLRMTGIRQTPISFSNVFPNAESHNRHLRPAKFVSPRTKCGALFALRVTVCRGGTRAAAPFPRPFLG